MQKIIKTTGSDVVIFDEHKNDYLTLNASDLNFVPQVGDEVEVHIVNEE